MSIKRNRCNCGLTAHSVCSKLCTGEEGHGAKTRCHQEKGKAYIRLIEDRWKAASSDSKPQSVLWRSLMFPGHLLWWRHHGFQCWRSQWYRNGRIPVQESQQRLQDVEQVQVCPPNASYWTASYCALFFDCASHCIRDFFSDTPLQLHISRVESPCCCNWEAQKQLLLWSDRTSKG